MVKAGQGSSPVVGKNPMQIGRAGASARHFGTTARFQYLRLKHRQIQQTQRFVDKLSPTHYRAHTYRFRPDI
jgi:hypothetical protein